jgi:hypothetical protein
MKSPFPGMDPWLETLWPDVHLSLSFLARDALNKTLPPDLAASAELRISLESPGYGEFRRLERFRPDVQISTARSDTTVRTPAASAATADRPIRLLLDEPELDRYVRIVEPATRRVITVIEFLSPANKIGEGLERYRDKRDSYLEEGIHVVEVDLVRRGDWRGLLAPYRCSSADNSTYRVIIRRADRGTADLYPAAMDKSLPSIAIPLRPADEDVPLPLQPLIDAAYSSGRCHMLLDYAVFPEPPFSPAEAGYIASVLTTAARG